MIHLKFLNDYSICTGNLIHILILYFKILAFFKKESFPLLKQHSGYSLDVHTHAHEAHTHTLTDTLNLTPALKQ